MMNAPRFYAWVTARPRLILIAAFLLLAIPAAFIPRLSLDSRIEAFIPADHPAMLDRARVKRIFGLGDPLVIAIVRDGATGVFTPETLALVAWLTDQLAKTPGIDPTRITSLATVDNIVGTPDGMTIGRFFDLPPTTQAAADDIRRQVMDMELLLGRLVARDGTATLLLAEPVDDRAEAAYAGVLQLIARAPLHGERVHVAGGGAVTATMGRYIFSDAQRLSPVATLVIAGVLFAAYRTFTGVWVPMLLVAAAVVASIGSMAAAAIPLNVITNVLPVLMIVIAVSEGIHILGEYYELRGAHPELSQRELVIRTMTLMWRPVAVTSLNDVVAFAAIYASSWMPPMRSLALFASIGRLAQFVCSLVVVPAALMVGTPQLSPAFRTTGGANTGAIGRWVVRWPRAILALAAGSLVIGAFGIARLRVDDSRVEHFNVAEPIRIADGVINHRLNGTSFLDVVVETAHAEDLYQPEHLRRIEALQRYLMTLPHVRGTVSVVDYLKQMHRAVHENQPESYRLPDTAALVAQYFLLYTAGGEPRDLKEMIDAGYQQANVRVTLDTGLYSERKTAVDAVEQYLHDHFDAPGIQGRLAGPVYIDHQWLMQVGRFSVASTIASAVAIWLLASWSFWSLTAGALAVIPVVVAEYMIYAVMGYANIWLGVSTSMFAAIAVGIGVDFSVHVIDRLIVLVRDHGVALEEAIVLIFPSTGRAVFFSFLSVLLGFAVFLTSAVPSLVWFGGLVAVAVLTSFVLSLTVLPALIQVARPKVLRAR